MHWKAKYSWQNVNYRAPSFRYILILVLRNRSWSIFTSTQLSRRKPCCTTTPHRITSSAPSLLLLLLASCPCSCPCSGSCFVLAYDLGPAFTTWIGAVLSLRLLWSLLTLLLFLLWERGCEAGVRREVMGGEGGVGGWSSEADVKV